MFTFTWLCEKIRTFSSFRWRCCFAFIFISAFRTLFSGCGSRSFRSYNSELDFNVNFSWVRDSDALNYTATYLTAVKYESNRLDLTSMWHLELARMIRGQMQASSLLQHTPLFQLPSSPVDLLHHLCFYRARQCYRPKKELFLAPRRCYTHHP